MNEKTIFWTGCILSRAVLILFLLTSNVGLMPDEAQYWTWSLFPDLGYYSKPPGIAWQIFLGTHLFGMNELGVRIISLLLPIPMALFIKGIVNYITSDIRTSYLTALAFLLSPLGMSASIIASTDGGMLLCSLATIYFYLTTSCHTKTGISIALGALWKWFTYMILFPIIIYEIIQKKITFRNFLILSCLAALGLFPTLFWNIHHNFATFRHVEGTILNTHSSHAAANPIDFFLASLLLISPGYFLLALPALFSKKRDQIVLLQLLVFIIFGGMLFISCFRKAQGNWGVLGVLFLFPLMGCYLKETTKKWLLPAATLFSLLLQAIFLLGPYFGGVLLKKNPLQHGLGLKKIAPVLLESGYTPQDFLFSDRYQTVSLAWFYGPEQKKTYFFNISNVRHNQFCFWPGMEQECLQKNGFFISLVPASERKSLEHRAHNLQKKLEKHFAHVDKPIIRPLHTHKMTTNYLIVIRTQKYLGSTPEQKEAY